MTTTEHIFNDLPYDIVIKIFSLLDQQDCLNCMAVCQLWYSTFPQYFQDVWSTLRLSNNVVPKTNKRWDVCIRSYCHRVLFDNFTDEEKLYEAMERLAQCSCDDLTDIEFSHCAITLGKHDQFISVWRRLVSPAITRVQFTDHSTDLLPCASILSECPNIYEFRFGNSVNRVDYIPTGDFWTRPQHPIELTNLTHLYLDVQLSIEEQLEPVLKASPNLKYLSFGDHYIWIPCIIDLAKLLTWCPKLIYLEANAGWLSRYRDPFIDGINATHNENPAGLRSFNGTATFRYGPEELGQYLVSNAATLESIALRKDPYEKSDWSHIFKSIHAPRLQTLICIELACDGAAVETMLSQCPSLESITFRSFRKGTRLDLQKVLTCSKHLEYVHLGYYRLHCDNPVQLFKSLVAQGSKIHDMELMEARIFSDELLQALPYFSTLKRLAIWFESRSKCTDSGLTKFAENILDRSAIDTLLFWKIRSMPFSVFRSLVISPQLKSLSIISHHRFVPAFTGPDLVELLNDERTCVERIAFMNLDLAEVDDSVVEYLQKKLYRYKIMEVIEYDADHPHSILIEAV